jgi:hypothetical protein
LNTTVHRPWLGRGRRTLERAIERERELSKVNCVTARRETGERETGTEYGRHITT